MSNISKDHIRNFGRAPLSPWLSGEQIESSPTLIRESLKESSVSAFDGEWAEPNVKVPEKNVDTIVFQSKRGGGNTVVINDPGSDEGNGFLLIEHKSGSVVQIDENGTVFIKSVGDSYDHSRGHRYERTKADKNENVGGSWNVVVERGSKNVYVQGDVNIECENYNLTARGKVSINAGESFELKASKLSIEAHTDNIDVICRSMKLTTTESFNVIAQEDVSISSTKDINLKSEAGINVESRDYNLLLSNSYKLKANGIEATSESDYKMKVTSNFRLSASDVFLRGSTVYIDDIVRLAQGVASAVSTEDVPNAKEPIKASITALTSPPGKRIFESDVVLTKPISPHPAATSSRLGDDFDDSDSSDD